MEWVVSILVVLALALLGFGIWVVGRRALQLCPH